MALIHCPECNKEISDKADICIHCGYPIKKYAPSNINEYSSKCLIDGVEYDLSQVLALIQSNQQLQAIKVLVDVTKCGLSEAKNATDTIKKLGYIPESLNVHSSYGLNQPKCPTCQSLDVEKISLSSKAIGGALFGLFSSDVRKTMHCKNCGYKW